MHFPLTEEIFYTPELSKPINKVFIKAFIDVVNHCYEGGKKPGNGYSCMTPELLKAEYARIYNEDPDDSNMEIFFPVLADYMTDAWRQGIMDSGKIVDVPLSAIQIYPCFTEHPPGSGKMETKAQYFSETGFFQSDIVLDMQNHLVDGYTSYLLAKQSGMKHVPVRYSKRQTVKAYHRPGGKLYEWELPEKLVDRVSSGDKVLVHTKDGISFATVAAVKQYRPRECTGTLQMVIRVKTDSAAKGKV